MRRAGGDVLALGVVAAAWIFGSVALGVLGIGLALATVLSRAWAWLVSRNRSVERRPLAATPVEGQPLRLEVHVHGRPYLASRVEWRDRIGALGDRTVPVARGGRAVVALDALPRGRYDLGPALLVAHDPLGLRRVEQPVPDEASLLVRPRVPMLDALFADAGRWSDGRRRARVLRPSGLDPHGVREYVEGEPLRAVHWPTSARRGELMVRELEDAPRESVAIVLDVDAATHAGTRGCSSLDDAVRASAGLLRAYAARSRRALLVIGTPSPELHRVHSLGRDWEAALDALAAVERVDGARLRELLSGSGPAAALPELVVVTARPEPVVDALLARTSMGRASALVAVDTPTYTGRAPTPPSSALLRLAGAGVPVAVLRHTESLAQALGAMTVRAVG